MDIFVITSDFPPYYGGIAKVLSNWAKYLTRSGKQVAVLAPKATGDYDYDLKQPYRIRRSLWSGFTALLIIGKYRPRKVIAGTVFPSGFVAYLMSFIFKFDYYIAAFGNEVICPRNGFREYFAYWIKSAIFRRSKKIFPCSSFTGRLVEKIGIEKHKIKVIYPGTDIKINKSKTATQKIIEKYNLAGKNIILSVSRLNPRKGHRLMIEAMPLILKKAPKAVYLIVGAGPEEKILKSQISSLKLTNRVFLIGAINDRELSVLYSICDVCVMLSQYLKKKKEVEGFGIAYLEAAAFGKPVIGTYSGGISEAVLNRKTGLLIERPDNHQRVASTIVKLLKNKRFARQLGMAGRKRIIKELNWEVQAGKLAKEISG